MLSTSHAQQEREKPAPHIPFLLLSSDFYDKFWWNFIKAALNILRVQVTSLVTSLSHTHRHTPTRRGDQQSQEEGVWVLSLSGCYQYGVVARRICRAMEKQGSCATP